MDAYGPASFLDCGSEERLHFTTGPHCSSSVVTSWFVRSAGMRPTYTVVSLLHKVVSARGAATKQHKHHKQTNKQTDNSATSETATKKDAHAHTRTHAQTHIHGRACEQLDNHSRCGTGAAGSQASSLGGRRTALTHSLTHSLTYSLTHLLTYPLTEFALGLGAGHGWEDPCDGGDDRRSHLVGPCEDSMNERMCAIDPVRVSSSYRLSRSWSTGRRMSGGFTTAARHHQERSLEAVAATIAYRHDNPLSLGCRYQEGQPDTHTRLPHESWELPHGWLGGRTCCGGCYRIPCNLVRR
eukprot:GHVU01092709.1.p1 GENE.GHVU01092709.1~~GHVU01092709.1.p1  ORF type:complete len:297 (+),score=12.64 GHVU01092709.1:129-1019(+)